MFGAVLGKLRLSDDSLITADSEEIKTDVFGILQCRRVHRVDYVECGQGPSKH